MTDKKISKSIYSVKDANLVLVGGSGQYEITRIRDQEPDKKPREKLIEHGPEALSSSELLAVILGVGTRKEELSEMTSRILREYGSHPWCLRLVLKN